MDDDGFGFAEIQGPFPGFEGKTEFVFRDDILEGFKGTFVIPYFEEESINHDSGGKGAVLGGFSLEERIVGLADRDGRGGGEAGSPGFFVCDFEVPQRFGGRQFDSLELIKRDGGGVVVGLGEHAEEDVSGVIGSSTTFIFDPFSVRRLLAFACL